MPLYLSDMASARKEVIATFQDNTVKVEYNPNDMSAATIRKFNAIQKRIRNEEADEDDLDWLFETGELMIAGWDLYQDRAAEEAGQTWPITKENLATLPVGLVSAMVSGIFDDMNPDDDPKESAATSDDTSGFPRSTPRRVKSR